MKGMLRWWESRKDLDGVFGNFVSIESCTEIWLSGRSRRLDDEGKGKSTLRYLCKARIALASQSHWYSQVRLMLAGQPLSRVRKILTLIESGTFFKGKKLMIAEIWQLTLEVGSQNGVNCTV
jgi:hypothetical protein